uniref:PKS/mFAS DH domain-containing protein n=1 Tax=Anopheles atroparvus TaxID=41427 RepID=A0A182IRY0_ANOAO
MTTKGYAIFGGRDDGTAEILRKAVPITIPKKYTVPTLTLIFGHIDRNWASTAGAFEKFPVFSNTVTECLKAIRECGFDAFDQSRQTNDPIQQILWTFITQVGVYRMLKAMDLPIIQYGGYSVGQIACAYFDDALSLHDAMRVAYAQGYIIRGHQAEESIDYGNVSSNKLLNSKLAKVLKPLRVRAATSRWINACRLQSFEMYDHTIEAKLYEMVGTGHLTVLEPLKERCVKPTEVVLSFLASLANAFVQGHHFNLLRLYPSIQFPVSQGTPMISPRLRWDHSVNWHVTNFQTTRMVDQSTTEYTITLSEQDYMAGHCIDGRILIPATGYLFYVWDSFSGKVGFIPEEMPVEFIDIEFLRATTLTPDQQVTLTVDLNEITGFFEVREGTALVVTGRIQALRNFTPALTQQRRTDATLLPSKDFYKELRLRGYHYAGFFRSVIEAASDGSYAKIEWKNNWTALLDCMLQVSIIAMDSRSLAIPTRIDSLKIDPIQHKAANQSNENEVPKYITSFDRDLNLLQCGAIEIRGLNASTIARRLPPGVPVLESYRFLPYYPQQVLQLTDVASIIVQTILENQATIFFTVAEIHSPTKAPIISHFGDAIGDLPLVKALLTLVSNAKPEPIPNVTITEDKLMKQRNVLLLICENLFTDDEFISDAINCLSDQGFILLRESQCYTIPEGHRRLQLVSTFFIEDEMFLLYQQKKSAMSSNVDAHVIKVSSDDHTLSWLLELKNEVKTKPVILYAQNDHASGIIGLVNCIRKEPNIQSVYCFFIDDASAPPFDPTHPFYKDQVELGLAINVYRNGQWGLYRHFKLQEHRHLEPVTKHCYANCAKPGDLSSFTWMVGPLTERPPTSPLIRIVYSSLNFKDVMLATGRLTVETFCTDRLSQECVLGLEFSGVTATGKRVMGIISAGSMATIVEADPLFTLDVPDEITLEQAATIPTVYATVYAAFFISTDIRQGKTILIHAGTGGIGLAAIRVAQAYGLEVFTTVSTKEKREFLLSYFPELNPNNIGNSRDITFEQLIKERTNGRGVDFVLNSLSEEKLQASVRCLAKGGHFLEIGKYDMMKDSKLALSLFKKGLSFSAVLVDLMFSERRDLMMQVYKILVADIAKGIIKPLPTTVFQAHEIEQAFRYLATAKHIGKVVLKIRDNEDDLASVPISYLPRVYCNPEQTMVIAGGLGGFGLELADWLIIRGCRKVLLSSSRGITKPYQQYRIK